MRLLALFCWLLAFTAQPAAAASSANLRPLEQQLAALLANRPGDYGVSALDLDTGEAVSVNGDKAFPMASTMKVAVAAAYLQQVDYGRRSLDDRIGSRSARQLMEAMLIKSDNAATDMLMRDLGGPSGIQTWLSHNGFSNMRVDRTIARLLADPRDLWDLRDSSTPNAMVAMLKQLDRGRVLKPHSRMYLLQTMGRCATGKNRIRGLLSPFTPVQHKTGTLNNYTSDVGYITLPDGRRLAVAFFARGGTDRPRGIAEAARTIYYGFATMVRQTFTAPAVLGGAPVLGAN
ncbi:serine hydrolase [Sphingomonas sp. GCM10030256]|uniref:serine hydrolase n=1 Tax=Sphingomonas sp. GCM10030256 TaxID=3273427 RepID=UPI00360BC70B